MSYGEGALSVDGRSPDAGLAGAVVELERHAAGEGWDQPARLFALVETARLAEREPQLAETLGDAPLTSIQQEGLAPGLSLEDQLTSITWPETVHGCAALVERLVLPPEVEQQLPDDTGSAATFAAEHPGRQEVRIVAAATRTGASYCALRLRSHDDDGSVLTGPDLVPGLLELVRATLEAGAEGGEHHE
ncbi:MAG TPA: PPA1309 family protein [Nocardioides sp.]|uniref:PPA1309 family protein n=1 Tax=Nocardioides sp. TaxID=35761 RepID=UPI002E32B680|nr:PPA1309 family protein [Nocardioides sp.]HEX3932227.1 PPA1309 family protein [Nocardioides sp.]